MEISLAHLRPYGDNPDISAYEGIFGAKYDHLAHPMSVCGCPVLIFEPPASRPTWSTHGVPGFYVGPDIDSYRSYKCWATATKSMRTSDTVQFFPAPFKLPGASNEERLLAAINELVAICTTTNNPALQPAIDAVVSLRQRFDNTTVTIAPNEPDDLPCLAPVPPIIPPAVTTPPDVVVNSQKQRVRKLRSLEPDNQRVPPQAPLDPVELPPPVVHNPLATRTKKVRRTEIDSLRETTKDEKKTKAFKKYAEKIGQRFEDTESNETFVIESVKMPLKARGKGSQTLYFVYTDVRHGHMRLAQREQFYTPCTELLTAHYARWLAPRNAAYAILSKEKYDGRSLNQRSDGLKFTYAREAAGPRGGYWRLAKREEHMRLLDSGSIVAMHRRDIPQGQVVTYYNPQLKEKLKDVNGTPHVEYRVRGTFGGNRSNYTGPVSSNTAEYPVVKILMNATVSDRIHKDPNTKFATADMVDFYLGTDLDQPGYMQINADDLGDELIDLYNLSSFVALLNGKRVVYFKVLKALYGHPAAGRLSFIKLKGILEDGGFSEHPLVDCLFIHKQRNIVFALIVDDMGIKYSKQEDLDYLISIIEPHWKLKVDITGSKFLGMHLVWQFNRPIPRVIIFNPNVVRDAISRFVNKRKLRGRSTPSPYTPPVYSSQPQTGPLDDDTPVSPETIKFVQEVTGLFNHYSRVIDYTMAEAVTAIARTQSAPNADTIARVKHLLNYASAHPNNCVIFEASDMILTAQSDASHQSIKNSRSKAGGVFYFANKNDPPTTNNGLIGVYSKIISVVCASASDAEYAALFQIAQLMYFYRIVADAVGYPQDASPIYVDNDIARGIADRSVKSKRSKSIEKSFHYIRDRIELQDIIVLRVDTDDNISDYFTKALPPDRHKLLASRINQLTPAECL
jgi:hypothetical protein